MADAEDTAIAVLVWLAGEPELMGRFLALTGLEASNMRDAAKEPGFLAGVLGFLMNHEPTLMDFCAATDTKPETVARAFRALGGAGEAG
jgi:hypothetical protein